MERFIGVLVEHYAGAFPPWLSPVQVQGIPIAERHVAYLEDVAKRMAERGLRVELDDSDDRMQKKIRNAQLQKVPFMVIAGDQDVEAGACRSATATGARTTASRSRRRSSASPLRWPRGSRSELLDHQSHTSSYVARSASPGGSQ